MGLFGTSRSKKTIHTEFIDTSDGAVFAVSNLAPEQIPESFAIETTLDMGGKEWSVTRAEPQAKNDILKAGKVRVYLTPITMMPPGDLLYSLPTISDEIGTAAGDSLPSPDIFALHEDDWRQIEFVAQKFLAEIEAELNDIRLILEEPGPGFRTLHVRKRIPDPFAGCHLHLSVLAAAVTPRGKFEGVRFVRTRGTIPHGFAWQLDAASVLWGVTDADGKVTCLCLRGNPVERAATLSDAFASLNFRHRLTFVDWCGTSSITDDAEAFRRHFQSRR